MHQIVKLSHRCIIDVVSVAIINLTKKPKELKRSKQMQNKCWNMICINQVTPIS